MTQQRALRTRAALLTGAATEFARHGYAASSVIRILENTASTKGAMYFHFSSKREMADAVLDTAAAGYGGVAERWMTTDGTRPLDALRGLVDDTARAFIDDVSLRAEARLAVEPELNTGRTLAVWNATALHLAKEAVAAGDFHEGFATDKFLRLLTASLAGHRLTAHLAVDVDIRSGYAEALEAILAAATVKDVSQI
ncbi:TetR family transcriptional regulator [Rhodococcus sp. NPDC076796]|uniref:TetR family transcriptional regulator n=1 Tax=Rhodococcus sp. NPDC076796 TaxID=3154859 RepID=UPI00344C612E